MEKKKGTQHQNMPNGRPHAGMHTSHPLRFSAANRNDAVLRCVCHAGPSALKMPSPSSDNRFCLIFGPCVLVPSPPPPPPRLAAASTHLRVVVKLGLQHVLEALGRRNDDPRCAHHVHAPHRAVLCARACTPPHAQHPAAAAPSSGAMSATPGGLSSGTGAAGSSPAQADRAGPACDSGGTSNRARVLMELIAASRVPSPVPGRPGGG